MSFMKFRLPIDVGSGSAVIAEACVKGRKKEAVVQCAMEACRILDRHDELRKAHHDSRAKKNLKNWKEVIGHYHFTQDTVASYAMSFFPRDPSVT